MKKLLANDEENTPVISEDNISNQSEVLVKPVHTKALQISELNQCFRMRHYYLIFIFCQQIQLAVQNMHFLFSRSIWK